MVDSACCRSLLMSESLRKPLRRTVSYNDLLCVLNSEKFVFEMLSKVSDPVIFLPPFRLCS